PCALLCQPLRSHLRQHSFPTRRSSDLQAGIEGLRRYGAGTASVRFICGTFAAHRELEARIAPFVGTEAALSYVSCWNANEAVIPDRKSTRLNSSHQIISYAVFCLKKKK